MGSGVVAVALLLSGCSAGAKSSTGATGLAAKSSAPSSGAADQLAAPEAPSAPAGGAVDANLASKVNAVDAGPAATGRKVVSTASLRVETDDLAVTKERAAEITRAAGGEVYQEATSFGATGTSTLTIKVPPDQFDQVLKDLGGLGRLAQQEIKTDDVTQQVIDLDARIRSAEASVGSVQGFVEKSTNLVETAQLENELQRRTAELESLRGQRQNLERRIDLSTIVLTLASNKGTPVAEEAKAPPPPKAPLGFGDGLEGGLDVLTSIGRAFAVAGGAVLPFTPFVLALVLVIRWRRSRRTPAAPTSLATPV